MSRRLAMLTHRLMKQHPRGVTTWNSCRICDQPARGTDSCSDCITAEIADLAGDEALARQYQSLIRDAAEIYQALEECIATEE